MSDKILTIELEHDGSSLIEPLDSKLEFHNILHTLENEIKDNPEDILGIEEGESRTFTITIHKKRTQQFMDELDEFDGF